MPIGDGTEALDTFYAYYRLPEDGYEVVVAAPQARLYHTVLHEIPPNPDVPWDITQERPGYHLRASMPFAELRAEDFVGAFVSGGRAPEYIRYDKDLCRCIRQIAEAGKPIACLCHGIRNPDGSRLHPRQTCHHRPEVSNGCRTGWSLLR